VCVRSPPARAHRLAAACVTADIKKIEGEENGGANGGKPGTYYVTSEKSARLKDIARSRGLWNFFLPEVSGVTVMEYSPIAEMLGATNGSHYMNCSAPDTGNMEVLAKFGNAEQKKQWLEPLLNQEIRSAFAMTEPGVASSDAQNISSSIVRDGDEYILNGHKWYISGAMRKTCKIFVFLGKTPNPAMKSHEQQSMILCPCWNADGTETYPGVSLLRGMGVFGHPGDHAEIVFDDVRVPAGNMILGEGRGFEIAQGRLGPGRIHHCMRSIGSAEMALSAIIFRIRNRFAFGSMLEEKDSIRQVRKRLFCAILCKKTPNICQDTGPGQA
jgi:acyl-CoA dehydrogenase